MTIFQDLYLVDETEDGCCQGVWSHFTVSIVVPKFAVSLYFCKLLTVFFKAVRVAVSGVTVQVGSSL